MSARARVRTEISVTCCRIAFPNTLQITQINLAATFRTAVVKCLNHKQLSLDMRTFTTKILRRRSLKIAKQNLMNKLDKLRLNLKMRVLGITSL